MGLSKRIGLVFLVFTSFVLAMNLTFRDNPDFILNVSMEAVLVVLFGFSVVAKEKIASVIQVSCLIVVSALAPQSPGGPIFSSVILVMALILIYAYGGFKSFAAIKASGSFFVVYLIILFSLFKMNDFGVSASIRAFMWTGFMAVICAVLWMIVEEIDRRFHYTKERELLRINRELIQLNHDLLDAGGCHDATGKS